MTSCRLVYTDTRKLVEHIGDVGKNAIMLGNEYAELGDILRNTRKYGMTNMDDALIRISNRRSQIANELDSISNTHNIMVVYSKK